jgi:phospholipase/lecithinase/hemolysin
MSVLFRIVVVLWTVIAAVAPAWGGTVDLSRLVVIGDSLSAGYQNGSLHEAHQPHGYAALVAAQAGTDLKLPLIAAPGIPNVLTLVSPGPPPVIVEEPGVSTGRLDPFTQTMNLAVPGHNVSDALTTRPDFPLDSLTDLVLGLPGLFGGVSRSQVEWTEHLAPSAILVWIGNMDALAAALAADASALTPIAVFEARYAELMRRLAATHATLIVANIPDVTVIPFLTPAVEVLAEVAAQSHTSLSVLQNLLGIRSGDYVTPDAFALIPGILTNPGSGPLPGSVVLTAVEIAAIRCATAAYNTVIAAQARQHGAALVDIHALAERLDRRGYEIDGQRLTTDFLGGLFSLDGVHPTNTGYAVIANEVIHELNRTFGAGIGPVNVSHIAREDPLVLPRVPQPGHVDPGHAAAVRDGLAR